MNDPIITAWPGGLKEKLAITYVGGEPTWRDLLATYPKVLVPFRRSPVRGDSIYRKETIDRVLLLAETEGSLVAEPKKKSIPPGKLVAAHA